MTAAVLPIEHARPLRRRRPQEAQVHEAVEALIAEGAWPANLSRQAQFDRVCRWLLAHGYQARELVKLRTFCRVMCARDRDGA